MNSKNLIKRSILLLLLFNLSTAWFSCKKTPKRINGNDEAIEYSSNLKAELAQENFTIVSVNEDSAIVSTFIATSLYDSIVSTTNSSPVLGSSEKQVFDTTSIELLYIPISENDTMKKSIISVFIADSNKFSEAYILEEISYDTTFYLKYYFPNGELALSA
ncbi:MAG: hypothetical protein L3J31_07345 [Bacteroidales bacterium]|nr:hypothetical protein [Bacteroidales bacterium]